MSDNKILQSRGYKKALLIGSGGVGSAYLCVGPDRKKYVCKTVQLKRREGGSLFKREVRTMQHLHAHPHPNVVSFVEAWDNGSIGVIVMQYLPGITISTAISAFGTGNKSFINKMALGMLEGLQHMHKYGAIHLDIKSENVVIVEDLNDPDMPLKAVIIDLGAGCLITDTGEQDAFCSVIARKTSGIQALIAWPYFDDNLDPAKPKELKEIKRQLYCKDMWQVGHVIWEVAYGTEFYLLMSDRLRENASGLILGYSNMRTIPGQGGHPAPPDFHNLTDSQREYIELDEELAEKIRYPKDDNILLRDQSKVAQIYHKYNVSDERDRIDDFNMNFESGVHGLIRLLLPTSPQNCLGIPQVLEYIAQTWSLSNRLFGKQRDKNILKNCDIPCDDPVNNAYQRRCERCSHCEWDKEGKRSSEDGAFKVYCKNKKPTDTQERKMQQCLAKPDSMWNYYRHVCEEHLYDVEGPTLHKLYAVLYKDYDTVTPAQVKKRIKNADHKQLDTYQNISKRLDNIPYHYLKSISRDIFYDLYNVDMPGIDIRPILDRQQVDEFGHTAMASLLQARERLHLK